VEEKNNGLNSTISGSTYDYYVCPGSCMGCGWAQHIWIDNGYGGYWMIKCNIPQYNWDGWDSTYQSGDLYLIDIIEELIKDNDQLTPRQLAEKIYYRLKSEKI
jgi:hypothetical protein